MPEIESNQSTLSPSPRCPSCGSPSRFVESFWDIRTKPPQRVPPPGPEQALRIHQNGSFSTTAKQERC